MNEKEHFDMMVGFNLPNFPTEEQKVCSLVDSLLLALYVPVRDESVSIRDPDRCKRFGIEDEPINWGDLSCAEAKQFKDGSWKITTEEASPDGCPTLCRYIEEYMESYGWNCHVKTEW